MRKSTDKDRLVSGLKQALERSPAAGTKMGEIEMQESILSAEYRAGIALRGLITAPMIGQEGTGGPNGHWLTEAERRAKYRAGADKHDAEMRARIAYLREITGDDDKACAARLTRIGVPVEWAR